jgi:hypothetical protein
MLAQPVILLIQQIQQGMEQISQLVQRHHKIGQELFSILEQSLDKLLRRTAVGPNRTHGGGNRLFFVHFLVPFATPDFQIRPLTTHYRHPFAVCLGNQDPTFFCYGKRAFWA